MTPSTVTRINREPAITPNKAVLRLKSSAAKEASKMTQNNIIARAVADAIEEGQMFARVGRNIELDRDVLDVYKELGYMITISYDYYYFNFSS
jgi:hypothetical protein